MDRKNNLKGYNIEERRKEKWGNRENHGLVIW